ncbi:hypothetical protein T265_04660 [Opisthorchis viverrini]|uniref:Uncharacterized protein n=1 Tax=Opisthorchis viverrini TaxID=6198 RepID=A0A075AG94_OPIVI|nr:hypothetical protein T265_04660 [Opisthorchis viverrini]KER28524.1 hypothetical protein T265_04660 [Opisthorchis viverrini]
MNSAASCEKPLTEALTASGGWVACTGFTRHVIESTVEALVAKTTSGRVGLKRLYVINICFQHSDKHQNDIHTSSPDGLCISAVWMSIEYEGLPFLSWEWKQVTEEERLPEYMPVPI